MSQKERIIELLASLGKTAEEVAASLEAKGIQGKGRSVSNCPISKFIVSEGIGHYIETTQAGISVSGSLYLIMSNPRLFGVYQFIRYFDNGAFQKCRVPEAHLFLGQSEV